MLLCVTYLFVYRLLILTTIENQNICLYSNSLKRAIRFIFDKGLSNSSAKTFTVGVYTCNIITAFKIDSVLKLHRCICGHFVIRKLQTILCLFNLFIYPFFTKPGRCIINYPENQTVLFFCCHWFYFVMSANTLYTNARRERRN